MELYYINGVPGSGKYSLIWKLSSLGYQSYDARGDGFLKHYNKKTGALAGEVEHSAEWHQQHEYRLLPSQVEVLAQQVKPVFLAGYITDIKSISGLFTKIIGLDADEQTLRERLGQRPANQFGRHPAELELILDWRKQDLEQYASQGIPVVDGSQAVDSVAREVLQAAGVNRDSTVRLS